MMNLDRILPNVFVGSCPLDADDVDRLKWQLGVTAVLNVQTDEDMAYWNIVWPFLEGLYRQHEIRCRRVPVQDFNPESLRALLPDCVEALRALLDEGHTVYVHCSAGMNRSPSTVIAYLHWIEGWGLEEAINHVTGTHACEPYVDAIRLATEDRAGKRP